jgi:adenylylsulfate kinase-like enzyme
MPPPPSPPHVFWLFGLSGAGKTTLAGLLAKELRMRNIPVLALDGDTVRSGLCQGLGFSDADRAENLRR